MRRGILSALCLLAAPLAAQDAPLSAIDWLSESLEAPKVIAPRAALEPPVTQNGQPLPITVQRLGAASPDPVGLLPPNVTGLPRSLWAQSAETVLLERLRTLPLPALPAQQELLIQVLLAEARPPLDASPEGPLFLARVDKLLELGALEQAQALVEAADLNQPQVFARWFDISLLTGTEDFACAKMTQLPALAPAITTRVFCLSRTGDWAAAALVLNTGRALGRISAEDDRILRLFLDPELAEEEPTFQGESLLPPPARLTPLSFRLFEAIGEPTPTQGLPRAFAHADLRPYVAWRNRIDSAERLVRGGALSENILIDAYTAHKPAASGGLWDRARAVQAFDTALANGDSTAIAETLPTAWTAMTEARTEVPFARFYAPQLKNMALTGPAAQILYAAQLLSGNSAAAARLQDKPIGADFLHALATGTLHAQSSLKGWEDSPHAAPILRAFTRAPQEGKLSAPLNAGKVGEALLESIALIDQVKSGDYNALEDGLLALRHLGLHDFARRTALELLLLERPL